MWLEDTREGTFSPVGSLVAGRMRKDTKKGAPFPLGVADDGRLCERGVEVRDGANVILVGTIQCQSVGDGALLCFDSDRDGRMELCAGTILGPPARLTNHAGSDDFAPAVSADGEWTAFSRPPLVTGIPTELWKMRNDGTELTHRTFGGLDENQFPPSASTARRSSGPRTTTPG